MLLRESRDLRNFRNHLLLLLFLLLFLFLFIILFRSILRNHLRYRFFFSLIIDLLFLGDIFWYVFFVFHIYCSLFNCWFLQTRSHFELNRFIFIIFLVILIHFIHSSLVHERRIWHLTKHIRIHEVRREHHRLLSRRIIEHRRFIRRHSSFTSHLLLGIHRIRISRHIIRHKVILSIL